jgi:MFS family permease
MGGDAYDMANGHHKQEDKKSDELHPDEMCGWGSWRPKWLQKIGNIKMFVACLCIIIFMKGAANYYTTGVLRTIEKRFNLNSTQTGFIMSVADIVQLCLIVFITYYGDKLHKPRILGIMSIALIISAVISGSINFMFPPKESFSPNGPQISTVVNTTLATNNQAAQVCTAPGLINRTTAECSAEQKSALDGDQGAYIMFIVSQVFLGLGGSGMNALGLSYIYENVPEGNTYAYFGELLHFIVTLEINSPSDLLKLWMCNCALLKIRPM